MTIITINNDNKNKITVGEELYLIYLKRRIAEEEEDDHEKAPARKRTRSIGDELYSVHLKRSQGMHLDADMNHSDHQKDVKKPQEDKSITGIPPSPASP